MNYNSPKEIAVIFNSSGLIKGRMPIRKFILLALLGGVFIAFGGLLTVVVAGGMPGVASTNPGVINFVSGALFPVGLIMVAIAGADLFTSDCTAMTLPFLQKQITYKTVLKVWILSYVFNFFGSQFVAGVLASGTGMLSADPWQTYLHTLAGKKINQDFLTVLIKGIGANWLVCLGMWMGYGAKDIIGKCAAIWVPVMLFVTLGFEHSIANMFFIPAAIYSGADITWGQFVVQNLVPATIGNIIGGAVFVGCVYWYIYLKEECIPIFEGKKNGE